MYTFLYKYISDRYLSPVYRFSYRTKKGDDISPYRYSVLPLPQCSFILIDGGFHLLTENFYLIRN